MTFHSKRGHRTAVAAGVGWIVAPVLVAALPALGAITTVTGGPDNRWQPDALTIDPGDGVAWANGGGFHNVVVEDEHGNRVYRNGDPSFEPWTTQPETFSVPGSYRFYCEVHEDDGMVGSITVRTPPSPQPTATAEPDTTPPAFVSRVRRRVVRRVLSLRFEASEDARLRARLERRRGRAFRRSFPIRAGRNAVRVGRLRAGRYRVSLVLEDASGNRSNAVVLRLRVR